MNYTENNGTITIFLEGHIDSNNVAEAEAEINDILKDYKNDSLTLDLLKLTYISSAGLRAILRLKKTYKNMELINVNSDVYEVFDMTGFTEMMDIQKAYRELSVDGCEQLGQGSNGIVYRLDPDTIIKVYRNPDSLPDIKNERELARKAFVLGIPTAIPYDVVKVGNTYGSVFELLNAKSFAKIVRGEPEKLNEVTEEYIRLLKQIHSTEVAKGEMPEMKAVAVKWVKDLKDALPEDTYNKLFALIEAVPQKNTMLHGDYHFNNVMVQNGETLLIDMDTLCVGHPVFEFASIFLAYVGFSELDNTSVLKFMGIPYELSVKIWDLILKLYFDTEDAEKLAEYENKAKIIGYTRLLRRTIRREPDNKALIEHCKNNIIELVDKTNTLIF